MSSVLAVNAPTSVARSLSSNAPSSTFVSSTSTSLSPSVNTASLLISVTTSPTPSTSLASAFSGQPSSVSLITMSTTTVATTAVLSLASVSVPSSTVPLTSARVAPISTATPSATVVASSSDSRSTTSTLETSVLSTTSLMTSAPTSTSSSLATTTFSVTASSAPILTSTSNTPFTTMSSRSPPSPSSQSSSPERTDRPITTVLRSTTILITSTNSQGQVMTSIPPVITEVITTTGSGGLITTITQAIVNPTLATNNGTTGNSSFFNDTGAVVGVFVVVGLASASIIMWILFAIRHRQRMKRIEQDTAVEAAVAAAGLNRAPLDDDEDDDSPISPNTRHQFMSEIGQRSTLLGLGGSGSLPTSVRFSAVLDDTIKDSVSSQPGCPVEHRANNHPEGYVPARTTSPSSRAERGIDDIGSSRDRKSSYGHTPTYSAGSFEPLLANYAQNTPDQDTSPSALQPPQNRSPHHSSSGLVPINGYSSDESPVRSRTSSKRRNSSESSVRDEEDYTRYVLMVRNIPDDQSQHSL